MSHELLAMAIIILIHLVGAGVLIWCAMKGDGEDDWRGWRDDGGGGGEEPKPGRPPRGPDGIPLPDAKQSTVRLREAGRIGDWRRRARPVPAHPPQRTPDPR